MKVEFELYKSEQLFKSYIKETQKLSLICSKGLIIIQTSKMDYENINNNQPQRVQF